MKLDSSHLKIATMLYYRFERQAIVATEVTCNDINGIADILVDTGDEIIEIETKIDRADLTINELKKVKHSEMKVITKEFEKYFPNKFYLCVPAFLEKTTLNWIEEINPSYGLLLFDTRANKINTQSIKVAKHAKKLHEFYNTDLSKKIVLRLCSELANIYQKDINKKYSKHGIDENSN